MRRACDWSGCREGRHACTTVWMSAHFRKGSMVCTLVFARDHAVDLATEILTRRDWRIVLILKRSVIQRRPCGKIARSSSKISSHIAATSSASSAKKQGIVVEDSSDDEPEDAVRPVDNDAIIMFSKLYHFGPGDTPPPRNNHCRW